MLYGGVSLAIYINGVAQELLSLVRATAPASRDGGRGPARYADKDLQGAEKVYRELARKLSQPFQTPAPSIAPDRPEETDGNDVLHTAFVVDIVSGTSAGGINGMFLGKALANATGMDKLRDLWISEGEMDVLLNDVGSHQNMPQGYKGRSQPTSLLNSQRMYFKLRCALDDMDSEGESSLADEIDLFITTTDLSGLVKPIQLADKAIYERSYRNVFHFAYGNKSATGGVRNDFEDKDNSFLAFAARCTSSFPVAFSYAIDMLSFRRAARLVHRKLIYVEPAPENPEFETGPIDRPDSFQNLTLAATVLPRAENVRDDLERVRARNRLVERVHRATRRLDSDVRCAYGNSPPHEWVRLAPQINKSVSETWTLFWLEDMIREYGAAFGAYHRLKVAALTSDLAENGSRWLMYAITRCSRFSTTPVHGSTKR